MFILGWIPPVIGTGLRSINAWQTVLLLNPDSADAKRGLEDAQRRLEQQ